MDLHEDNQAISTGSGNGMDITNADQYQARDYQFKLIIASHEDSKQLEAMPFKMK